MKLTATMALKQGMILAEDVYNYKNELLLKKNSSIDDVAIAKLNRHKIMCVEIKDAEDLATTHFEKVRASEGFKKFVSVYKVKLEEYKAIADAFVSFKKPDYVNAFIGIYKDISACAKTPELLLDYLYNMLPSEDDLTYAHCLNSALIAGVFATWIALPSVDKSTLIHCAFLYDIGKLKLPYDIIWKPSKLTDAEYDLIKTHPILGYQILKDQVTDLNVLQCTLMHHEKFDGSGYPSKLNDDRINIFAKYVSIIDAYEAMTSARTYRSSLIPFQVIENFEKTERFYNSSILRRFLIQLANSQVGMTVRLNNERTGEVILINQQYISRPLIKCDNEIIDLARNPQLKIDAIL